MSNQGAYSHLLVPLTHMVKELQQQIEQFYWDGNPNMAKSLENELKYLKGLQEEGQVLYPLF